MAETTLPGVPRRLAFGATPSPIASTMASPDNFSIGAIGRGSATRFPLCCHHAVLMWWTADDINQSAGTSLWNSNEAYD